MDNAQVYMSLIRPTGIPVAGECAADIPFTGQVELHGWSWTLFNLDEKRRAKDAAKPYTDKQSLISKQDSAKASGHLERQMAELEDDFEREDAEESLDKLLRTDLTKMSADDIKAHESELKSARDQLGAWGRSRKKKLDKFDVELKKTLAATGPNSNERDRRRADLQAQIDDANEEKNYEFSFSKRVDLATTQLLNSMKSGDIFPTGVLTIHQSSANAGLSLVITVQKLRLIDYALKVEVSETMTDMREEWTAQFASLAYVYKNRKSITKSSDAGQAVAKAASQGTVRMFTMKNIGSPI